MLLCHLMILPKESLQGVLKVLYQNCEEISGECLVTLTVRRLEFLTKKVSPLPYPKLEINIFTVCTDIIESQYHGDVVVLVLCTVTVKEEHGSYVGKNFERPHYVPLNKKSLARLV